MRALFQDLSALAAICAFVAAVALCCPWAPTHGTDHTRGRLRAAGVHVPDAWCPMEYAP